MSGERRDRRAQRARRRRRARGRARLRGHRARRAPARAKRGLMQAVILAGGEGTRLRPLTSTVPKPVVTLVDRPFIVVHARVAACATAIDDVIMSLRLPRRRRARRARRRLGLRRAPALRRGARAARHRRRAASTPSDARRALPRCSTATCSPTSTSARSSPQHERDRRDGDARAGRRRGPERLRARAPRRRSLGARVRREAEPRAPIGRRT